ncbi:MAG: hypothetical protein HXY22_04990 [Alphaproteobacteria bacterium]|nr:hypothetical protein [Alphaproteobacteria bacterium]
MIRLLNVVAILVAMFGLNACLISPAPLITPDKAAYPFADGARLDHVSGDTHRRVILLREGNYYLHVEDGGPEETPSVLRGMMYEFAPGAFILQAEIPPEGDKERAYMYAILTLDEPRGFKRFDLTCGGVKELLEGSSQTLKSFGLSEAASDSDCMVETLDGLSALAKVVLAKGGEADSTYVPVP